MNLHEKSLMIYDRIWIESGREIHHPMLVREYNFPTASDNEGTIIDSSSLILHRDCCSSRIWWDIIINMLKCRVSTHDEVDFFREMPPWEIFNVIIPLCQASFDIPWIGFRISLQMLKETGRVPGTDRVWNFELYTKNI